MEYVLHTYTRGVVTALHTLRENAMRFCGTNRLCEKGYGYYAHASNFATLMSHNFVEIFTQISVIMVAKVFLQNFKAVTTS